MNQLLYKPSKVIAFLIWTLWIPVILFCSYLLISIRNGSTFVFVLLFTAQLFMLFAIGRLSIHLEKINNTVTRILKQFIYGFFAPLCSIIISIIAYDEFLGDHAIKYVHLIKELSILAVFLYIVNIFCLVIHLDRQFSTSMVPIQDEECYNKSILVYHKGAYMPVNLIEIALIYQQNQINWLITFKEEEYILDLSLKDIHEVLCVKQFFKINRNQIVHKDAILKFRSGSFGKIDLILNINSIHTTVSKGRAKDFRKWFFK